MNAYKYREERNPHDLEYPYDVRSRQLDREEKLLQFQTFGRRYNPWPEDYSPQMKKLRNILRESETRYIDFYSELALGNIYRDRSAFQKEQEEKKKKDEEYRKYRAPKNINDPLREVDIYKERSKKKAKQDLSYQDQERFRQRDKHYDKEHKAREKEKELIREKLEKEKKETKEQKDRLFEFRKQLYQTTPETEKPSTSSKQSYTKSYRSHTQTTSSSSQVTTSISPQHYTTEELPISSHTQNYPSSSQDTDITSPQQNTPEPSFTLPEEELHESDSPKDIPTFPNENIPTSINEEISTSPNENTPTPPSENIPISHNEDIPQVPNKEPLEEETLDHEQIEEVIQLFSLLVIEPITSWEELKQKVVIKEINDESGRRPLGYRVIPKLSDWVTAGKEKIDWIEIESSLYQEIKKTLTPADDEQELLLLKELSDSTLLLNSDSVRLSNLSQNFHVEEIKGLENKQFSLTPLNPSQYFFSRLIVHAPEASASEEEDCLIAPENLNTEHFSIFTEKDHHHLISGYTLTPRNTPENPEFRRSLPTIRIEIVPTDGNAASSPGDLEHLRLALESIGVGSVSVEDLRKKFVVQEVKEEEASKYILTKRPNVLQNLGHKFVVKT